MIRLITVLAGAFGSLALASFAALADATAVFGAATFTFLPSGAVTAGAAFFAAAFLATAPAAAVTRAVPGLRAAGAFF